MKKIKPFLIVALATALQISCKKDLLNSDVMDVPIIQSGADTVKNYIDTLNKDQFNASVTASGGCLITVEPIYEPVATGETTTATDGAWSCQQTPFKFGPQYSETHVFSPDGILWVGSIVRGGGIQDGTFPPLIVNNRKPLTLTTSMFTTNQNTSFVVMNDPSLSSYNNAHNTLAQDFLANSTPAYINFEIDEVKAYNQVIGDIGSSIGGWGADIAAHFNWENKQIRSRFLIKLIQKYYTVEMDIPALPSDWFYLLPDPDEFISNCPVYISSITYGRMIYIIVESTSESEATRSALEASFSGWGVDFNFSWSQEINSSTDETSISAFVVGGSASSAAGLVDGLDAVGDAIKDGAEWSLTTPGAPIAFTTRRISDNSIVNFVTISEYTVNECTLMCDETTVAIDETKQFIFTPDLITGDGEFGGCCIVAGNVTLFVKDGKEVWAKVYAEFNECGGNDTRGLIDDDQLVNQVLLYTAPEGKTITSILVDNASAYFNETDGDHLLDEATTEHEFINHIYFIGDTDGDDLPGDYVLDGNGNPNNDRSYLRVQFKDFKVCLVDLRNRESNQEK